MILQEAKHILKECFGIDGELKSLQGEVDYNFRVKAEDKTYTLKISRPGFEPEFQDFQVAMLDHLSTRIQLDIPSIYKINNKSSVEYSLASGEVVYVRLHDWVEGEVLTSISPWSKGLFESWGRAAGILSKGLVGFDHSKAHRDYKWDPSRLLQSKILVQYLEPEDYKLAMYFFDHFEEHVLPKLPNLRKSINHNDLHELNVLASNADYEYEITGVIDFGDALYTETINELAITCAYAGMNQIDPMSSILNVVKSYHEVFPIHDNELEVLYGLVAARLLISVCAAAENAIHEPENPYLQISAKPAWTLLKQWKDIHPNLAHYRFRNCIGLEAHPNSKTFIQWLDKNATRLVAPIDISEDRVECLDLSIGSQSLGNFINYSDPSNFHKWVQRYLEDRDAHVGIGGYLENRPIYLSPNFQFENNSGKQWRTLHLGLDVWKESTTEVRAALDGVVYGVGFNPTPGDYGGVIILKHELDNFNFFTLYGHLSESSSKWNRGDVIRRGEVFATLGDINENGTWPPHLHFQIILDMLGEIEDFIGVAFAKEKSLWSSICPDPIRFFYPNSKHVERFGYDGNFAKAKKTSWSKL